MIIVTGAAGFIGSALTRRLNDDNFKDLVLVDDFSKKEKALNYQSKSFTGLVERDNLFEWIKGNQRFIQLVFHLGARTDTTEFNKSVFDRLNLNYSKQLWSQCAEFGIPLIYASSAATYGMGELGYADDQSLIPCLKPLNPYGESKNEFDKWALVQDKKPSFWAGFKFFNVYGPNEYHKGRMASVVYHSFKQVGTTGKMRLFRSHNPRFKDGEQKRDFIYVKDVVDVLVYMMNLRKLPGIYNLGSGKARTFIDLARYVFQSLHLPEKIEFIDTPADIRDKYQYFTEARMEKLRSTGYNKSFTSLEHGIDDYINNYLLPNAYL